MVLEQEQNAGLGKIFKAHLETRQIRGLEIVGRAAAPVHNVLVLTFTSQLAIPVGEPQVVVHHGLTVSAVLQHRVEKGLWQRAVTYD